MSDEQTSIEPMVGQIWDHSEHEYSVLTTRVTNTHVQYTVYGDEADQHANAAREYVEETFGYSLAFISPIRGSRESIDEFMQVFSYQQDRPRESYESSPTDGSTETR